MTSLDCSVCCFVLFFCSYLLHQCIGGGCFKYIYMLVGDVSPCICIIVTALSVPYNGVPSHLIVPYFNLSTLGLHQFQPIVRDLLLPKLYNRL